MKKKQLIRGISLLLGAVFFLGGCGVMVEKPQATAEPTQSEDSMTENNVMIEVEDILSYTAEDIRRLETASGKQAAVTIDVVCLLCEKNYRLADVRETMISIRNAGIKRVFMIMCSPSYPVLSGGMITACKPGMASTDIVTALKNFGEDPNKVFIQMCKEYGMEAIAVVKPYEGGGGVTIPEGTTLDAAVSEHGEVFTPETVGGFRAYMDSFIAKHPEMRVRRKPGTGQGADGVVTAMEIYYQIGSALERHWGTTRFSVFYFMGILLNVALGFLTNSIIFMDFVNLSMFFPFATLYPDMHVLLYGIIPIRIKWLAWLDAALFGYTIFSSLMAGDWISALLPIIALLNYFVFFWDSILSLFGRTRTRVQHRTNPQTINFKKAQKEIRQQRGYLHKCAVCGITDTDDPDMEFRYCSKCNGYYCYCMNHINNHSHVE